MKKLTSIILAAVAASFLAAPMASAQPRFDGNQHVRQHYGHSKKPQYHKPTPPRYHWSKGKRLSDWRHRQAVRDYHRYGLKRPAKGQRWVKIDNDFLLISLATGVIAGIVAGR
jgi:Ni/Co efflux regulator RcnB